MRAFIVSMAQRNYLISTTALSTTASGTTITSGNTQSATFVVSRTMVRTGIAAGEFLSGSQTWSLHYVVSAMVTPYEMRLKVQRLNSGGTMQAESGYTTVRTATGTFDDNLTADLGTWAANDQLAVVWEHRRPSGSGNKNATIDANGASYVDAPAATDLVIQSGSHAHSAENLALTQVHVLTIQDASHSHTAENVVLAFAVEPSFTLNNYMRFRGEGGLSVSGGG